MRVGETHHKGYGFLVWEELWKSKVLEASGVIQGEPGFC